MYTCTRVPQYNKLVALLYICDISQPPQVYIQIHIYHVHHLNIVYAYIIIYSYTFQNCHLIICITSYNLIYIHIHRIIYTVSYTHYIIYTYSYGVVSFILFPKVDEKLKTNYAEESYNPNGIVPRALSMIKSKFPDVILCTDIALDPYSSMVS